LLQEKFDSLGKKISTSISGIFSGNSQTDKLISEKNLIGTNIALLKKKIDNIRVGKKELGEDIRDYNIRL